jgi:hypothetical protein
MALGVQHLAFSAENCDFAAAEMGTSNFIEVYKFDKV